ncbi:MAG: Ig-like domain-containing protein, partial [Pirellulaceae bacterium]
MSTPHGRRRQLRRRTLRSLNARGELARLDLERLEPRLLLSSIPRVVSHDLPDSTTEYVAGMTLTLSEPVVGVDARDAESYELLHLGADQLAGGGDDRLIDVQPTYVDGSTQIELGFSTHETVDLGPWSRDGHLVPGGGLALELGTWTPGSDMASVVHESTSSDYPSYYVSADNLVDAPFYARMKVESDASDDMIGLVFSLKHRFYGEYDYGPETFYALTWKRTTEDREIAPGYVYTAEEGLKLLRFQSFSGVTTRNAQWMLWDGDSTWVNRMSVLTTSLGDDRGWEPNVEYACSWWQHADGTIDLSITRASDGSVVWETSVLDPTPLPAGATGFLNLGVPQTRYSHVTPVNYLPDGAYQLRVVSGDPGLRAPDGTPLDGDGDGHAGGDFMATTRVDRGSAALTLDLQAASDTGQSSTDNLTNDTTPTFDVTVSGPGRIITYFNRITMTLPGEERLVAAAGVYEFTSPELVPHAYQSTVVFIPSIGPRATRVLPVTIETTSPRILNVQPYGVGNAALDHFDLTFCRDGRCDHGPSPCSHQRRTARRHDCAFAGGGCCGTGDILVGP